jgi:8-oxo-dGTP pyrophosphatase MutT (NUDIX family)
MAKKKKRKKKSIQRKSAVIPFRFKNDVLQLLLITPKSKDGKSGKWMIPKGTIKAEIRPAESARIEALEEAGVLGEILRRPKGIFRFETKKGSVQQVQTYFLKVTYTMKDWEEKNQRHRKWIAMENIHTYIDDPNLMEIIEKSEGKLRRIQLWDRVRRAIFSG